MQRCSPDACAAKAIDVRKVLELGEDRADQIVVLPGSVKELLSADGLAETLLGLIPPSKEAPF